MDAHLAKPVAARDLESVLARYVGAPAASMAAAIPASSLEELRSAMGEGFALVVQRYLDDAVLSLEALRVAAAVQDDAAVEDLAHRLKGSSGMVGAMAAVRLCEQVMERPRDAEALERLGRELALVREQLHDLVKRP
jgi:HPt (histidine-containing phosphotransfer) domain-containing protein